MSWPSRRRLHRSSTGTSRAPSSVIVVVLVLIVVWYVAAIFLNAPFQLDSYARNNVAGWS